MGGGVEKWTSKSSEVDGDPIEELDRLVGVVMPSARSSFTSPSYSP